MTIIRVSEYNNNRKGIVQLRTILKGGHRPHRTHDKGISHQAVGVDLGETYIHSEHLIVRNDVPLRTNTSMPLGIYSPRQLEKGLR